MSWIDRLLPRIHKREENETNEKKKESAIPEGLWTKCPNCEQVLYTEELEDSLMVCPKCGFVYVPEDLAMGKVLSVEKVLEDK